MPRALLFDIVPDPQRVRLEPEFRYWRWLPWWRRHYGCPDCRKSLRTLGTLTKHLKDNHPRWQAFLAGLAAMRRPPPMSPEARRAKRVAAQRAAWNRPEVRAKLVAAMNRPEVRAKLVAAMNRPEVRAKRVAAAVRSRFWEFRHSGRRCEDCGSRARPDARNEIVRCVDRTCGWVGVA